MAHPSLAHVQQAAGTRNPGAQVVVGCARPGPGGRSHWRSLVAPTLTLASSVFFATCAHVSLQKGASERVAEYLETHREVPPAIAEAMDRGHLALGMDRAQVVVVLGQPLKRTEYGGSPPIEVWLYPGARFHQDPLRTHGATLFRLVFIDARLRLFEPL